MRRGLPLREMKFLDSWYEDYMYAKYGSPPPKEEDETLGAPWEAETIVGGHT